MEQHVRVLIADDNPRSRNGLRALLRSWPGIEVIGEAADGQDAVRIAGERQPSVVLMDVRMPGGDGVKAAQRIKNQWPRIKIVVLTMYPVYRSEALAIGADAFLVKGCPAEELLDAIAGQRTPAGLT